MLDCVPGTSSKLRCAELVVSLLHDLFKIDPIYANAYRGIMDARRMLRKQSKRLDHFIRACKIADKEDLSKGPMRGTTMHAQTLGIQVIYRDQQVFPITPRGCEINLCTDQGTHLRSCLRESAKYASIRTLQQRIDITDQPQGKAKRGRKDMQGITPYIDTQATLANVNIAKHPNE